MYFNQHLHKQMDYPIQEYCTEAMQAHLFSFKSPFNIFHETMLRQFCFIENNKQTKNFCWW